VARASRFDHCPCRRDRGGRLVLYGGPICESIDESVVRWAPAAISSELSSLSTIVEIPTAGESLDPGGRTATAPQPLELAGEVGKSHAPKVGTEIAQSTPISSWSLETDGLKDLARIVGPLTSGAGTGNGTGDGHGDGSGSGGKFFETRVVGKRFVFVVDCSQSMNHPDPSEFKTRFNRLKMEMAKSITKMEASSQYFIIFFNDRASHAGIDAAGRSQSAASSNGSGLSLRKEGPTPSAQDGTRDAARRRLLPDDGDFLPASHATSTRLGQAASPFARSLSATGGGRTLKPVAQRNGASTLSCRRRASAAQASGFRLKP
jgi:hypothetical protein